MRLRLALLTTLAGLSTLTGACGPADQDPAAQAQPELNSELLVTTSWLAENLDDPNLVILHTGPEHASYAEGHIPGAHFLPIGEIVVERDGNLNELPPVTHLDSVFSSLGVDDDARVVIYGAPLPAGRTFFTLDYLGHGDRTALLDGGLELWKEEGRPLSRAIPESGASSFTSNPQPEVVVDADWVAAHLGAPQIALLDARPEDQYTGEAGGDGLPRAGHIPGAGNIFWQRMIDSPERPILKDPDELRELFREAGIEPGDTVVTYCRTGMQASFAYFVSRYLGYETRMYDGSFMDWSPREELPVEESLRTTGSE